MVSVRCDAWQSGRQRTESVPALLPGMHAPSACPSRKSMPCVILAVDSDPRNMNVHVHVSTHLNCLLPCMHPGTLTPIVANPDEAFLSQQVRCFAGSSLWTPCTAPMHALDTLLNTHASTAQVANARTDVRESQVAHAIAHTHNYMARTHACAHTHTCTFLLLSRL